MRLDGRAQLFPETAGILERGVGGEDGELLSAPAGEQVRAADVLAHHLREFAQDMVAHTVAVAVVDRLEMVDVEQQE